MKLVRSLLAPLRRSPALTVTFAIMWIATLVPLWRPRFLPLLDLPNHLDAIAIWHRYSDPEWGYSKFYRLNLLPVPYWGYFFPVHMLAYLMPIEVANKVYLSAYALCLPLGASMLARQMGRSAWLGLFTFPLVFNMNFQFGFITFCAGMTLMLFAIVILDRFLQEPTRGRGIALFFVTLGLYTTHVLPWLFFGVAALFLLFCHGRNWGRMLAASAAMLPSVAFAAWAFGVSRDGSTHVKPGKLEYAAKYETLANTLEQSVHRLVATWPENRALYLILAGALVWLLVMSSSRAHDDARLEGPGYRYRLELLVALACAATLFLPMHLFKPVDLWMIGGRFVSVVALLAVLLPRGPIVGAGSGKRGLLLVLLVALHLVYVGTLTKKWMEFDKRAASVRRLCRLIPRGSSTLTLMLSELSDPSIEAQAVPYVQFHAYAQFFAGGYEPWALNTGFPMVARPEAALPSPRWKQPRQFRFDDHGIYFDYVLTRGESYDHQLFGPDDSARAPLVKQDADWRLYQVVDPQPVRGRIAPHEGAAPASDPTQPAPPEDNAK